MGGLVQQPAPARADRKHPTRRGRSPLPRARRDPIFGRVTQANLPPANSVRFTLALALAPGQWSEIAWREGSTDGLTSRFARVRVRPAHRDYWRSKPHPQEWLLIEWPQGEKEPTKYWLSTLPEDTAFESMVELAKLRWRIERDYQDLKQELGLGHYEGRGWRGFHHHASLCIAAYGFLIAERVRIPPSGSAAPKLKAIGLPTGDRPRGASDPTGAARPK